MDTCVCCTGVRSEGLSGLLLPYLYETQVLQRNEVKTAANYHNHNHKSGRIVSVARFLLPYACSAHPTVRPRLRTQHNLVTYFVVGQHTFTLTAM